MFLSKLSDYEQMAISRKMIRSKNNNKCLLIASLIVKNQISCKAVIQKTTEKKRINYEQREIKISEWIYDTNNEINKSNNSNEEHLTGLLLAINICSRGLC